MRKYWGNQRLDDYTRREEDGRADVYYRGLLTRQQNRMKFSFKTCKECKE